MAGRIRKDLEVTLLGLAVPSLQSQNSSHHLLTVNLLWPRVTVAGKSTEKEIELCAGQVDWQAADWCRKILFKESVDNTFGLEFSLTTAMSRLQIQKFSRFMAGNIVKMSADVVDDAFPAGDLAALPLLYASKNLLQAQKPASIVRGTCTIVVEEIPDEGRLLLEVPLLSTRVLLRRRREGGHRDHVRYIKETLLAEGAPDGAAKIQLRIL